MKLHKELMKAAKFLSRPEFEGLPDPSIETFNNGAELARILLFWWSKNDPDTDFRLCIIDLHAGVFWPNENYASQVDFNLDSDTLPKEMIECLEQLKTLGEESMDPS